MVEKIRCLMMVPPRSQKNVFKQARLVLQAAPASKRRDYLRDTVDLCKETFDRFAISASQEDMEELVARWTHLKIALGAMPPLAEPDPPAGRLRAALAA